MVTNGPSEATGITRGYHRPPFQNSSAKTSAAHTMMIAKAASQTRRGRSTFLNSRHDNTVRTLTRCRWRRISNSERPAELVAMWAHGNGGDAALGGMVRPGL